jgi:poly(A) polymerase
MLACMLWHDVEAKWTQLREQGEHPMPALSQAIDAVFDARIGDISGRGKLATDMREIWLMQPRFERRNGNAPYALVEQPRFRAGFDFLRLRADAGEVPVELAEWWEDFSLGSDADREALVEAVRESGRPKRGAGPRRAPDPDARRDPQARAEAPAPGEAPGDDDAAPAEEGGDAPRKRRRRRRKPAGAAAADAEGRPAAEPL